MRVCARTAAVALVALVAGTWTDSAFAQLTASSGFGGRTATSSVGGTTRSTAGGGSSMGQQSLDLGNGLLDQIAGAAFGEAGVDRSNTGGFFGQRSSAQSGGFFGATGGNQGRGGGFNFGNFGGGRNRQNPFLQNNNNQENRMYYRPRRTVAFVVPNYATIAPERVTSQLIMVAGREEGVTLNVEGVSASMNAGRLVLRGKAATAHDRALAEQLARLEPGVTEVVNEIQLSE